MSQADLTYTTSFSTGSSPELATIADIQKMNGGESRASIYRALARGELQAVKRGRRTLIIVESARERIRKMPPASFKPPRARNKPHEITGLPRRGGAS